ncbi:MAG: hypothetical protein WBC91_21285 [Phototrophicaceae bacterium]
MSDNIIQVEQVTDTLNQYYLHHGRVVVYEPIGARRETVDMWKENTLKIVRSWQSDQPYHEIHDMRQSTITPYAQHKATELTKELGTVAGRAAIVIEQSYTGELIGFFVNNVFNRFNKIRERRVFTNFETALAWIEEVL